MLQFSTLKELMKISSLEGVYSWVFLAKNFREIHEIVPLRVTLSKVAQLKRALSQKVSWEFSEMPLGLFFRTPVDDGLCL